MKGDDSVVIIHYAGITNNSASGVSVVVPQIVNNMAFKAKVALYNFSDEIVSINYPAVLLNSKVCSDDYRSFPNPFSMPDLVIFHSPFGIPKMVNIVKRLIADKIPYIIVPHGCFSRTAMKKKWLKKTLAMKIYYGNVIKRAKAIQYLCENEKKNSVIDSASIIISNGVIIPEKINRSYENLNNLVFIGRKDIYHKGIDKLIEACSLIKNELAEKKVCINLYGPGNQEQNRQIENSIKQNELTSIVINRSAVFEKEKEEVLRDADLFLLTSRFEGQPIAILEALSFSIPVIVTPGTGFFDEVNNNNCGIAVDFTAEKISTGILNILNSRAYAVESSKNAYEYVRNTYSWKYVTEKALKIYEELCDEENS